MPDYCTRAQVLLHLPDVDATDYAFIDDIITAGAQVIDTIAKRGFDKRVAVTRLYDGRASWDGAIAPLRGSRKLFLKDDLVTLTQLRVRDTAQSAWRVVPLADVLLEPGWRRAEQPARYLKLVDFPSGPDGAFPSGDRTIEVTGDWGRNAIPKAIELLNRDIAVRTYKSRANGMSDAVGVEGIESFITTKIITGLDREIVLRHTRESVFA